MNYSEILQFYNDKNIIKIEIINEIKFSFNLTLNII